MADFPYSQLDVFPSGSLTGNPLAAVHDAEGLTDEQMQRFARWTNLSETVFLTAPTTEGAHYRTRIFTPTRELPFAGHPTLGSAYAWLSAHPEHTADVVVQECGVGLVDVRRTAAGLAFAAPPLVRSGPADETTRARVAAELNLDPAAILAVEWVQNGPEWVAVLLADADAVLAVRPGAVSGDIGVVGPHPAGAEHDIEVRAFVPRASGTDEDPVTGSLNAGLAMWLLGSGRVRSPYVARQGTAIGRDGRVHVEQDADGTIWVGGAVRTHIRGTVAI